MEIGTKVRSKMTGSTGTIIDANEYGVCVCWDGSPWSGEWMRINELEATKLTPGRAIEMLVSAGAASETKEDHFGDIKSGWWMDTVFLSKNPVDAWEFLNG